MKKLTYQININSPVSNVYDKMLGVSDRSTYEEWTTIFSPTSSFEGNWEKGSKMLFTSIGESGEREGMVSKILENNVNEFVSIQHIGMLKAGKEITEGPEVDEWSGGLEDYSFEQEGDVTNVSIAIDSAEEYEEYMNNLYPNALQKLKEVCERD